MKFTLFFVLFVGLGLAAPAFAGNPIGGVFFVCSSDPDQERHFEGVSNETLEDEARRIANQKCDDFGAGVATQVVYVYKDGSQKGAN